MNRAMELIEAHPDPIAPPPRVLGQLLSVVADENHRRSDVELIMRSDMALTTDILRIANSSRFSGQVSNIGQALLRIGESDLCRIAIRSCAACMKVVEVEGYGMHDGGMWKNSVYTAIAADLLAQKCQVDNGLAYTAGLLLDVGKRILGQAIVGNESEVIEAGQSENFVDVERAMWGVDHAEIGAELVASWGLPDSLAASVRWHHRPWDATEHVQLAWICHVADFVALNLGGGGSIEGLGYRLGENWQTYIPINSMELSGLLPAVQDAAFEVLAAVEAA